MKVSTRLKQLREERGLTRQAVELGCVPPLGKGLISKYEKGKGTKGGQDPNADTVRRLAAFFKVPAVSIDPTVEDEPPTLPERIVDRAFDDYPSLGEALPHIRAKYPPWVAEAVANHRRKGLDDPGRGYFMSLAVEILADANRTERKRAEIDALDARPDVSDAALDAEAQAKPRRTLKIQGAK